MGLKLIYGRAGTGKSEYCFSKIKDQIKQNDKVYIITPEQFSYTQEKKLLEHIDTSAIMKAEVLTFKRMAYRIMTLVGGLTKTNLSKTGRMILLSYLLQRQKRNLIFLNQSEENLQVIDNEIRELKKHMISKKQLENVLEETQDPYRRAKLKDIVTVYGQYQEMVQKQYLDEDDILTNLVEKIDNTDLLKDTIIYIDEFSGFTKQEYEIIRKLLHLAKEVNITICTDSLEVSEDTTNLFYANQKTAESLINIAKQEKVLIEKPVQLETVKKFQKEELLFLETSLSHLQNRKYEKELKNISLFLAQNPFLEIEEVASRIILLVKENNYRFQDISIITKNIEGYSSIIKAVFARYEIPVFIDQKKELSENVLVKYILSILDIFSRGWSYETVFAYLKTGFTKIVKEDLFLLENYVIKYGIKGKKWYEQDWKIAEDQETLDHLNEIRKSIVNPLLSFKERMTRQKTVEEITKALYEFLVDNQVGEKLDQKVEELKELGQIELANIYETTWDTVMTVLDEMVLVLGKEKISFEDYTKLLKIGMQNSKLGAIPATADQVIVGDVERSRTHKVRACFLIGLNDGVFPSNQKDEGFLNDKDRIYLKEKGIELAKTSIELLYEENFNLYKAFLVPEERLFLSYSSSDQAGKTLRPSILISKLKRIFPKLEEETASGEEILTTKEAVFYKLLEQLHTKQEGKEIEDIWYKIYWIYAKDSEYSLKLEEAQKAIKNQNHPDPILRENIDKLYGDTLKTSISRLEQYRKCEFSFYLKYGLELNEQDLFQIKSVDTGTFMHDIIDSFFDQVIQRELNLKEMTEEEIEEVLENILNEKLTFSYHYKFSSTKKYRILTRRLKKVVLQSMKYIIETITQSDFHIYGNEIEFKKNAKYPPIQITLEEGRKVEVTGKIDRVDLAKNKDGTYVRIIDYKSSIKSIDLNEVMAGLQIQLLTYLDAVAEIEKVIPAGVLYFNLIDPIIKADRNKTDEEIEQEIKKQFKMQGFILADVNVVRMMDHTLEKGASNLVPAYIDQNENLSSARSNTLTKEQFQKLQKQIHKIMKDIAEEIYQGKIDIKPYYHTKKKTTPCDYCQYRSICNFDPNQNGYWYLPNREKEEILASMKGEEK